MSHFTVMVIGDNPEEQLEKFDENITIDEYEKGVVSDENKQKMLDYYAKKGYKFSSFDACYKRFGEEWNDGRYRKDENGIWHIYSTYNPDSKWDWYVLGGRWSGRYIILKPGATSGIYGSPECGDNKPGIDAALKKDIDFDAIRKKYENGGREYYREIVEKCGRTIPKLELFWETIRDGEQYATLTIDEKQALYHAQPSVIQWEKAGFDNAYCGPNLEDFQCTEDEYVQRCIANSFVPYAFVMNGEWHGKGDMGWWGISSNELPQKEWQNKVWKMVDALPDDTMISFYDCHI